MESDDYEGYIALAETGAPLVGGESKKLSTDLVELGRTSAVNFLQGDLRHHERFTGYRPEIEFIRTTSVRSSV